MSALVNRLLYGLEAVAVSEGMHPGTAYGTFRRGTLPVPARRAGRRLILVGMDEQEASAEAGEGSSVGLYTRASFHDREADFDRQLLTAFFTRLHGKRSARNRGQAYRKRPAGGPQHRPGDTTRSNQNGLERNGISYLGPAVLGRCRRRPNGPRNTGNYSRVQLVVQAMLKFSPKQLKWALTYRSKPQYHQEH